MTSGTTGPGLPRATALAIATAWSLICLTARADDARAARDDDARAARGGESDARPAERAGEGPSASEPSEEKQALTWPFTLDITGFLGSSIRLGAAPSLTITDRAGLVAGAGIVVAPSRLFSIGLVYEHVNLGAERLGNGGVYSASVDRDANALWADLRVYPVRSKGFPVFVFAGLGLGLEWQRARATGVIEVSRSGDAVPSFQLFQCSASGSASVGLRGNAGIEVPITQRLLFVADASFENARLTGEVLDNCISGAGTTSVLALKAGLASRFDLSSLF